MQTSAYLFVARRAPLEIAIRGSTPTVVPVGAGVRKALRVLVEFVP